MAEWIKPLQNMLTAAKGEILYKFLILNEPNFLNFGALRFVKRIGTNASDNKREIKINGSYFSGLLKFNKSDPEDRSTKDKSI